MNLKDLTWEAHKRAERKGFAKRLVSGKITPEEYYRFLRNQWSCYTALESVVKPHLTTDLHAIFRAEKILEDIRWLENEHELEHTEIITAASTVDYVNYVYEKKRKGTSKGLLAHVYVKHFGDIYGGSIIQKRIPGPGYMYNFDNKDYIIREMRKILSNDMAPEAIVCFEFTMRLFEDMEKENESRVIE